MKPDPETRRLALLCIEDDWRQLRAGTIDTATFRRDLRLHRRIVWENSEAPTSLATEGRVLPYMGRHRLERETNAGR